MLRPRRVLVPVDFSSATDRLVRTAADLVKGGPGRLLLFHVFDQRALEDVYNLHGLRPEEVSTRMRAGAEESLARLRGRPWLRGVKVESRFATGLPPEAIVEHAKRWKADLVVLAPHRRTGLAQLLYGRTSDAVVRESPCAVLILDTT